MKYLINHQAINSDQIVRVNYAPEHQDNTGSYVPCCAITLTSTASNISEEGYVGTPISEVVTLYDAEADRFWYAYIGDAYAVVTPKD